MTKSLSPDAVAAYHRDGYLFPQRAISPERAAHYRACLERYEAGAGGPINSNFRHKVHLLFTWANELVHDPVILEAAPGTDIGLVILVGNDHLIARFQSLA